MEAEEWFCTNETIYECAILPFTHYTFKILYIVNHFENTCIIRTLHMQMDKFFFKFKFLACIFDSCQYFFCICSWSCQISSFQLLNWLTYGSFSISTAVNRFQNTSLHFSDICLTLCWCLIYIFKLFLLLLTFYFCQKLDQK